MIISNIILGGIIIFVVEGVELYYTFIVYSKLYIALLISESFMIMNEIVFYQHLYLFLCLVVESMSFGYTINKTQFSKLL